MMSKSVGTKTALGGLLLVFVLLRSRWIGHLLAWDEAMTLNTVRSLVTGTTDPFSLWFWRHPPLFTGLTAMLSPLADGFAERVEWLAVLFTTAAACLLWRLNQAVFGGRVALFSVAFYAVFPGAVFFDTWCKGDPGVTLFGLLGLWLLAERRDLPAGLALALAFLSKELALFYALGMGLMLIVSERGLPFRRLLIVFLPSLIALAGWYGFLMLRPGEGLRAGLLEHVQFASGGARLWFDSPWFYVRKLPVFLGWAGVALTLAGVAGVVAWTRHKSSEVDGSHQAACKWWPVLLLAPAYIVLSLVPAKVTWLVMSLFPAWATLAAVGLDRGLSWLFARRPEVPAGAQALTGWVALGLCLAGIAWPLGRANYEAWFRRIDESQWRGAARSRENARAVNAAVSADQRLLFTSFHYWRGNPPGFPCAVFTYYLRKDIPVLVRSHTAAIEPLLLDAARYKIDWLLLSPEPKDAAAWFEPLMKQRALVPDKLQMAWLFRLPAE